MHENISYIFRNDNISSFAIYNNSFAIVSIQLPRYVRSHSGVCLPFPFPELINTFCRVAVPEATKIHRRSFSSWNSSSLFHSANDQLPRLAIYKYYSSLVREEGKRYSSTCFHRRKLGSLGVVARRKTQSNRASWPHETSAPTTSRASGSEQEEEEEEEVDNTRP